MDARGEPDKGVCHTPRPVALAVPPSECSKTEEEKISAVGKGMLLGAGKSLGKSGRSSLPPTIDLAPTCRHVFRFTCNAGTTGVNVRAQDLIGVCGGVCTVTNSTFRPMASSVRIHKVTVWQGLSSTGFEFASVWWATGLAQARDSEKNRTIPQGSTITGPVVFTPPPGTLAAFWQTSASTTIFAIACAPGSVVDVDLSFTLSDSIISSTTTIATGVLGTIYYGYLDGPSNHQFMPVGLVSTF